MSNTTSTYLNPQAAEHYASRPPGEVHGPFRSDEGCRVLDISLPQRSVRSGNQTPSN